MSAGSGCQVDMSSGLGPPGGLLARSACTKTLSDPGLCRRSLWPARPEFSSRTRLASRGEDMYQSSFTWPALRPWWRMAAAVVGPWAASSCSPTCWAPPCRSGVAGRHLSTRVRSPNFDCYCWRTGYQASGTATASGTAWTQTG